MIAQCKTHLVTATSHWKERLCLDMFPCICNTVCAGLRVLG